ncbi:MAG: hypothetical protein KY393_07555 [Actinobacteria bacterium]|nr:hypothetical protein [Actinomycetota bacterium]
MDLARPIGNTSMRYWSIYLNDNLALMVGAQTLARRAARSNKRSELGVYLGALASELETDIADVRNVMEQLSVPVSRVKVPAVRIGAFFGRLKLNGRILKYSGLSKVVELEALCLLAASKQRFWESIADVDVENLAELNPSALAARSGRQLKRLSELRRDAARRALADP